VPRSALLARLIDLATERLAARLSALKCQRGSAQADLQPGSQCRHECQQCVGQLTTMLPLRDRWPRTTGPP
jgi:hypothetical protein